MRAKQTLQVTITLSSGGNNADKLSTLLQRGFLIPVTGAVSISELLGTLPGFSNEYIRDRVQTIFVNGLAEDNSARELTAGDTLALSAAMPGLAGAIFRRGGQHASLRTRPLKTNNLKADQSGHITLKLFNMVATETGPRLLEKGLFIKAAPLARFLDRQGERILPLIKKVVVEDSTLPPSQLAGMVTDSNLIFLTIHS